MEYRSSVFYGFINSFIVNIFKRGLFIFKLIKKYYVLINLIVIIFLKFNLNNKNEVFIYFKFLYNFTSLVMLTSNKVHLFSAILFNLHLLKRLINPIV
jgi:hypothetical protein